MVGQELDVELVHGPLPLMIVRNFYTQEELSLIWRELEFFNSPHKWKRSTHTGSNGSDPLTGMPLANAFSLEMDAIFSGDRQASDILRLNRKIFDPAIIESFAKLSPLVHHIKYLNEDTTKLKYYEQGEYYRGHFDTSRFTACTYFFKEPKCFVGGDLHFEEYDYTVPIENNMVVLFVGSAIHSSTEVRMIEEKPRFSMHGKYVMSQFLNVKDFV
jgi:hypothetical protein